jgi:hypothetical protein
MSVARKLRGLVAGVALTAVTLGAVSMGATPSQATDIRFGVVLTDRDHRPALRREAVPPAPHARYVRWETGHWVWTHHRWVWTSGHYDARRQAPRDFDRHEWHYER